MNQRDVDELTTAAHAYGKANGWSNKRIAEALGITSNALRLRVRRECLRSSACYDGPLPDEIATADDYAPFEV